MKRTTMASCRRYVTKKQGAIIPDLSMTLRDYFAGQALAGYMASEIGLDLRPETIARDCYAQADAMLAERSKS